MATRRNLGCSISSIRRRIPYRKAHPVSPTTYFLTSARTGCFHGRAAEIASQQVKGLDVKAVHMAMMVHCTGGFHQYSSNDYADNCEQAIMQAMEISNLDETGLSSAHDIPTEVFGRAYLEVRAGYFTH
jgi:hypothetical protein